MDELMQFGDGGRSVTNANDQLYIYDTGIFDFDIYNLPSIGAQVRVVLPLIAPLGDGDLVYRKYIVNEGWLDFDESQGDQVSSAIGSLGGCPVPGDSSYQLGLQAGAPCIQLLITDGGPNDADDANGVIRDPSAVGFIPEPDKARVSRGGFVNIWLLLALNILLIMRFSVIVLFTKLKG
jgi:hypothetical protein